MPRKVAAGPVDPVRSSAVELFFDLVFIFTLGRLSATLVEEPSLLADAQAVIFLLAFWWIWYNTNLATDSLDCERPTVQILIICVMLGSLLMSINVPDAFGDQAFVFVSAYLGIHLGRTLVMALYLRGTPAWRRPVRGIVWYLLSGTVWFAGAAADGDDARVVLWACALAIDYSGPVLGWPVPGLGRARATEWHLSGEHLNERYRQFIILALGETILATGNFYRLSTRDLADTTAFLLTFWTVVFLWWTYFYRTTSSLAVKIDTAVDPYRLNLRASYTHLVMVAGILLTGIGGELMLKEPGGQRSAGNVVAILIGPLTFLVGRMIFEIWVFGRLTRHCLAAVAACLILSPVAARLPPLAVGLLGAATITVVAIFDLTHRARIAGEVNPVPDGDRSRRHAV
ncbi:low temperature requirement protein A [Micromonospora sp. C97]|uniref:Low temperature requirement protein A n=1 Tax=Micromonospora parva TaxID=1464048 RepID=A0ABW6VYN7_9ACTN|nr:MULTISPECIES: low temperature requirement protein A [Micromonospora]MBQ1031754.1 low temperature requirement protein A [Micromonospora sp. C97]